MLKDSRLLLVLAALATARPAAASGEESHYAIVFGSQTRPLLPRETHTWVTFVRINGAGADPSTYAVDHFTVSWLPATLMIRPLALDAEPGVNLDLFQSLQFARSRGQAVEAWGPIPIAADVYHRAWGQFLRLRTGTVRYRVLGAAARDSVDDCRNAILDIDPSFGSAAGLGLRIGFEAARYIASSLSSRPPPVATIPEPSWLLHRLGLDRLGVRSFLTPNAALPVACPTTNLR